MKNPSEAPADWQVALGRVIRRHRGAIPQTAMAKDLGVSQGSISGWEHATNEPPLSRLAEIEEYLALPRGTLLVDAGYVAEAAVALGSGVVLALARLDAAIARLIEEVHVESPES